MPPKRRGAQAKTANPATKAAPPESQSKQPSSSKSAPTSAPPPAPVSAPAPAPIPPPAPPPPPPQPLEAGATRVRKEWSKFMDAWYQPQNKKLVEKLQKDLLVKYKSLGSAKETQKLREMELFERLDSIAQQLAQPARAEWERRLELAQLREEQWDDMSAEEQYAVMSVFDGFFGDDVEDIDDDDDDVSADPSSVEEESIVDEPPYRGFSYPPSAPSRQPVPPTPARGNFEFVNPTSFFADTMTPPNPSKNLPELSMDHLATLGSSSAGRSVEPVGASVGGMLSFQNWASEAGIVTQSPMVPPASLSAQTLSTRPRATDHMSRQASAVSSSSSPPFKPSSPQYSPPYATTKPSPPINADNLPLGKRYIGPVIMEEEPDPMDDEVLKSRMADEYQQYKISLRIQMIYQFHAEAAEVEIKLFETLLAHGGTKESRARAVQEHETSMMRLREQKEEERKKLCAEEREKRREEIRQHLAQRRSAQNREVDPGAKGRPLPDKASVQQRPGKATYQRENGPLPQLAAASSKLEPPSVIKKSISTLSQDEVSANEAFFANAMTMMSQGKPGAAGLIPAQVSQNEALFSNAAAMLAAQSQLGSTGKSTLHPPNMKKSNSSRSQEYDVPQITVSFADHPTAAPEPAQAPLTTAKGKKGRKGQSAVQPPAKPVTITEELEWETSAESPPSGPSIWDAASTLAKNTWDAASSSISAPRVKFNLPVEDEFDTDLSSAIAPAPPQRSANTKKATPATKKGKKVTITEEPDVDADPIISLPPQPSLKTKGTKGGWGSASGKSKAMPFVAEESEPEPVAPPPPVAPVWGKRNGQAATKSAAKAPPKVTAWQEQESEVEPSRTPAQKNKAKSGWGVPSTAQRQQVEPRRSGTSSGSKSARVDTVPDAEGEWSEITAGDSAIPGVFAGSEDAEEEGDANAWPNPEDINYWANFMGSQSEAEPEAVPRGTEQTGEHARWTPTVGGESEDEGEFGEGDEDLATNMWMQYAISGSDIPSFGDADQEPHVALSESAQHNSRHREQGKGKKVNGAGGDFGSRVQQTTVFDRAAIAGQWPKMDSWLSPPSRGQNSGSTRVF